MDAGGAGNSVLFKSGSLFVKAAIYSKSWISTYKIGGKVGLRSEISDSSVHKTIT